MYKIPELDKDYITKWIEAEYQVLGWWKKKEDIEVGPIVKENKDEFG